MSDIGSFAEMTLKNVIQIGETIIDNVEVEGLLAKAAVGVAAVGTAAAVYGLYKVLTDSSAAENVATVAEAVNKHKER